LNGTFIANVFQSLRTDEQRRKHQEHCRSVMRMHFRCEGTPHFVEALGAVVNRTYPDWFTADLFDATLGFGASI
jgi:hypothetical protein